MFKFSFIKSPFYERQTGPLFQSSIRYRYFSDFRDLCPQVGVEGSHRVSSSCTILSFSFNVLRIFFASSKAERRRFSSEFPSIVCFGIWWGPQCSVCPIQIHLRPCFQNLFGATEIFYCQNKNSFHLMFYQHSSSRLKPSVAAFLQDSHPLSAFVYGEVTVNLVFEIFSVPWIPGIWWRLTDWLID